MRLNRNSWHYKLVNNVKGNPEWYAKDICSYTRKVLASLIVVVLVATLVSVLCFFLGDFIGYILASLFNLTLIQPTDITMIPLAVFGVGSVFGFSFLCCHLYTYISKKYSDGGVQTDNFIIESYKSFKGKYCANIEFVDKK